MKRLTLFETNDCLDDIDYEALPLVENCSVILFLGHVPTHDQSQITLLDVLDGYKVCND